MRRNAIFRQAWHLKHYPAQIAHFIAHRTTYLPWCTVRALKERIIGIWSSLPSSPFSLFLCLITLFHLGIRIPLPLLPLLFPLPQSQIDALSPLWTGHRGAQKRIALTRTDSARRPRPFESFCLMLLIWPAGHIAVAHSLRWEHHISKKEEGLEFVSTRWRDDE